MTFNLGIMKWRLFPLSGDPDYPNFPRYARWIEVNRITSYWDENGRVFPSRATCLFPCPGPGPGTSCGSIVNHVTMLIGDFPTCESFPTTQLQ